MVSPGARVGDAELHGSVNRDEIAAIAEEQGVLVGGMLHGPQDVFGAFSFLALMADRKGLDALSRECETRGPWATANASAAPGGGGPSNRHAQSLDQALLVNTHHRQGRGEPGHKAQSNDQRFQSCGGRR